ncbi:site-specific integrase [Acinetobacter pittii]|jgi:integrase|uniref:site-specific integrase n=1 Tax=Acinetobacter pittii TaxID=48296 RepID=UPI00102EEE0A|nr:site-specific integrase [Acinetobacter pittii]RZG95357.1 site-specific integrase [Acinetobacter pittii]
MKSQKVDELNIITERLIVLLDGRQVNVPLFSTFGIKNRDQIKIKLNFGIFSKKFKLHVALSNIILDLLSTHSIQYVATILLAFENWMSCEDNINHEILSISTLSSLQLIKQSYIAFITPILRRLSIYYPNLIEEEFKDFLENPNKWEERKPAYFKLITNDPEKGAFTLQELDSIHSSLNFAFSNKSLSLFDYTLTWFLIATGARPVQLSRLKYEDIQVINKDVMIKMPLAKGEGIVEQGYFLRKAPTILADCIIKYIESYPPPVDKQVNFFKLNPTQISNKTKQIFENLSTYSSRLEAKIPVNAYRFRYTLATRALASGASDQEVARLLTHRSLSCIHYYRASMPELQKPIQDALDEEMNFFAKAFKGKIIPSLDDAKFQESAIADFFRLAGKTIGSCGTQAKCYQNAPIACLTCPYFEPLVDAPWDKLLQYLVEDQAKEQSLRIKEISLQAIRAVKDIINLIELRHN